MLSPSIDFSTYSDEQLETAFFSIDRFRHEMNFQSCSVEIQKRKLLGTWKKDALENLIVARKKKAKVLRMIACAYTIAGLAGLRVIAIQFWGATRFESFPIGLVLTTIIYSLLFALTAWAGWSFKFSVSPSMAVTTNSGKF
jgi:hypothetical protein